MRVYNLQGRLAKQVARGRFGGGRHQVRWDGRGDRGRPVACGVYLYVLEAAAQKLTRKLLVIS